MPITEELKDKIVSLNPHHFEDLSLEVFRLQARQNAIYQQYLSHLAIKPEQVHSLEQIPYLPIEFFKSHRILSTSATVKTTFASSGTTGQITSQHLVTDPDFYDAVSEGIFEAFFGPLQDFHILALLPSYLERSNSSLVHMVRHFIAKTQSDYSGFYLHNTDELLERLSVLRQKPEKKVLLIGVTFALLDLAETADLSFLEGMNHLIVMETGGMKGRREELLREQLHEILTQAFHVPVIHSEYGMTELLSQGYSFGEGLFHLPASMKITLRDVNDPFHLYQPGQQTRSTGGINIIDLANIDSCSFLETKDLGSYGREPQTFRVLGRFDNSDLRGCNLMVL
ncbi:acyl transferase [Siphonobacter sp. SORGH_AS_1065]|uniref:LuxE/PaaK family acyltransferase n=1 Tax=Siphonobacter sp. SORGH_AS_1065 TaxID=3041795 RepID=UPI002782249A|nr:acyl transferase [Siphonobacter sp. SORGH_AS_1065]MDQ1086580.1 phenylacetate-coenzyme A ligase PaaK-like adenylate-forming protein [Siphonobacter sp. SORGH_AS_1065]